jgi:hypothetical protein
MKFYIALVFVALTGVAQQSFAECMAFCAQGQVPLTPTPLGNFQLRTDERRVTFEPKRVYATSYQELQIQCAGGTLLSSYGRGPSVYFLRNAIAFNPTSCDSVAQGRSPRSLPSNLPQPSKRAPAQQQPMPQDGTVGGGEAEWASNGQR